MSHSMDMALVIRRLAIKNWFLFTTQKFHANDVVY